MVASLCRPAAAPMNKREGSLVLSNGKQAVHSRFAGSEEPDLAELIDDPMTRRLMASDGVRMESLLTVLDQAKTRLQEH